MSDICNVHNYFVPAIVNYSDCFKILFEDNNIEIIETFIIGKPGRGE